MKHFLAISTLCLLTLTGMAQKPDLVGTWLMLGTDGTPTTSAKVFMPDGKLLGLSFSSDYSNHSVWYMSEYKVLSSDKYMEHTFYHSNIEYQHDYIFTYHKENDSLMVTTYNDYLANGVPVPKTEKWKKTNRPLPAYTADEWQSLQQKSMAEFDRLPKEGQTTEQYAEELYKKYKDFIKAKKLDRASEALLIRAEMDTTNRKWQDDVAYFYLENKVSPPMAERITSRIIRLAEAKAPTPNDTSVVSAWRKQAYLYYFRGKDSFNKVRNVITKIIDMETTAGHQPTKDYGLDYFFMASTYLPEGDFATVYDYSVKSADIMEKAPDVSDKQKGEVYMMEGVALMNLERLQEAIDIIEKAVPLFVDENGKALPDVNNELYPIMFNCYEELLSKNPKDKKLQKAFEQFLEDKLVYAVFEATNKEWNLWGEYNVLERDTWTLEKPTACPKNHHYLFEKNGKYVEVTLKEGQKIGASMRIVPVDAETKQKVINNWKAYKKGLKD